MNGERPIAVTLLPGMMGNPPTDEWRQTGGAS